MLIVVPTLTLSTQLSLKAREMNMKENWEIMFTRSTNEGETFEKTSNLNNSRTRTQLRE